jgi:hypothetical protein
LTAFAAAVVLTAATGCGEAFTDPPEGHEDRLHKAAGVAAFELVVTQDLWDTTIPPMERVSGLRDIKGTDPGDEELASRGLMQFTMSGRQLVAYLEEVERDGYGGWSEEHARSTAEQVVSKRVYDEIAPVIDAIEGPRGPEDPAPRLVLDDTVPQP